MSRLKNDRLAKGYRMAVLLVRDLFSILQNLLVLLPGNPSCVSFRRRKIFSIFCSTVLLRFKYLLPNTKFQLVLALPRICASANTPTNPNPGCSVLRNFPSVSTELGGFIGCRQCGRGRDEGAPGAQGLRRGFERVDSQQVREEKAAAFGWDVLLHLV